MPNSLIKLLAIGLLFLIALGFWLAQPIGNERYLSYSPKELPFAFGIAKINLVINEIEGATDLNTNTFNVSVNIQLNSENNTKNCTLEAASIALDNIATSENIISNLDPQISNDGLFYSVSGTNIPETDLKVITTFKFSKECNFSKSTIHLSEDFIARRTKLSRLESWLYST